MQINADALEIVHHAAENHCVTWLANQLSKPDYPEHGDTIVMVHVGVYPEHRGWGVAGKLTQATLEYARSKPLRVLPMCSYVAAYFRRNPEYAELMKPWQNQ